MTVQELLEEQFNIPGTWYDSIIIHTEGQTWWKGEYFEYNREADDFLNNEGVSVTDKYGNVEELGWGFIEDDNAWMYIEIPENS